MDRKKAIEELNSFLSNIEKSRRTTAFKIVGNRNVIAYNYAEGFGIAFDISGDQNTAIYNEAHGHNYAKIAKNYCQLIAEVERHDSKPSRIRRFYEGLKQWGPTIATVVLGILRKYRILEN